MTATPFPDARILIIDDQDSNIRVLRSILAEAGYLQVSSLMDSNLAVQTVEELRPDLILLDLLMPFHDGFAVMDSLRPRMRAEPFLPILVLTADCTSQAKRRALSCGARDFLTKPFDVSEVLLRIRNLLETRFLYLQQKSTADRQIQLRDSLIDQANDAIVVLDPEQRVKFWNKGAQTTYGWTAQEAYNQRLCDLLHPISNTAFDAQIHALLQDQAWSGYLDLQTKEKKNIQVACRWTRMHDEHGDTKGILVIGTDVTETKRLEAQAYRSQRLDSIGTLAGGIAHDIGNALNPLPTAASLLRFKNTPLDPEVLEFLDITDLCVQRATDLLRQILAFARGAPRQRRVLNVGPLIQTVTSILRRTVTKSITVKVTIADNLGEIEADPTEIDQVIMNLCLNAVDAMPTGGLLTIDAKNCHVDSPEPVGDFIVSPGDYVRIVITDTGTGISQEAMDRIFDPFFTTKNIGKGTGLGLSVCHGIVKSHNGILGVTSVLGSGTSFFVYLPVRDDHHEESGSSASLELLTSSRHNPHCLRSGAFPPRARTILVVDDEVLVRQAAARILSHAGYRVLEAEGGQAALSLFAGRPCEIDAVLTDVNMPIMTGVMLANYLARLCPSVRLVAMSGHSMPQMEIHGFLRKPFTPSDLLNTIEGVFATHQV